MHPKNLKLAEIMAAIGGVLLGVSVFLKAYVPSDNPNAFILKEGSHAAASAWDAQPVLRFVLLAAALTPLILAYIILRDHELSWPRGEVTAVIGIFTIGLIVYNAILDRPGEPPGQIGLGIGFWGMFIGAILICVGGAIRSGESERRRKPPGVL